MEKILQARLRLLLQQWPIVWVGNLLVQFICAIILWSQHDHFIIMLWVGSNLTLFSWRLLMRQRFPGAVLKGYQSTQFWAYEYAFSGLVGGLIWGAGAWLFFSPEYVPETIFLLVVMIGIVAGALPSLSSYSLSFILFACGTLIPMATKLWVMDWGFSGALAALSLIYLGVNVFYSRNMDRTICASITLDLANQNLLQEVSQARDIAEKANQSKSRFLAAASHDLRQPLHAMGLFMESLKRHLKGSKERYLFENIQLAHDALEDMFDALMEISHLEVGGVKPVKSHFYIQPVIHKIAANFDELLQQKELDLVIQESNAVVTTDIVLLSTIIRNLLSNAVKYTDTGSIAVTMQTIDDNVRLCIKDTGIGIPDDKRELIFSEYQQLDNPERDRDKGLGLGLSVVKKMTELLSLPFSFESTLGAGSSFCIDIPLGEAHLVSSSVNTDFVRQLNNVHVLLVDDDSLVREATINLLGEWGCLVTVAESMHDALSAVKSIKQPVDILMCDYRLKEKITGVDVITGIRQNIDAELPAFLMTGDTDPKLRQQLNDQGFYVLNKPIKPAQLRNTIINLMD